MNFSLNVVRIGTVPDCFELNNLSGKIGWDVFSSHVLCDIIKKNRKQLGIAANCELPKALGQCLGSPDEAVRSQARTLTDEFGRRLALVLYSAKQVQSVEYGEDAFQKFQACTSFLVGGGLAAGDFGEAVLQSANEALDKVGCAVRLDKFVYAQYMPIVGCASLCPEGGTVVFDFGQTYFKSAKVDIDNHKSVSIQICQKQKAHYMSRGGVPSFLRRRQAFQLDRCVQRYIIHTATPYLTASEQLNLVISMAGKSAGNELLPGGAYGKMEEAIPRYRAHLEKRLSAAFHKSVSIKLLDDEHAGAVAAAGYDGLSITMGTAFGLGEPAASELCNTFDEIRVTPYR